MAMTQSGQRFINYVKELNGWTIQSVVVDGATHYRLAYFDDPLSRVPSITVEGMMPTLQDAEDRARDTPPCDCG
jgi:hypothetical protein